MTDFFAHWANQKPKNARLLTQELLIAEVTEAIWKAMEDAGVNKTELAGRMDATKGYVSQVLSGSRNMTLRTLADICFALEMKPVFAMEEAANKDGWQPVPGEVDLHAKGLRYTPVDNVIHVDFWGRAA